MRIKHLDLDRGQDLIEIVGEGDREPLVATVSRAFAEAEVAAAVAHIVKTQIVTIYLKGMHKIVRSGVMRIVT